MLIVDGSGTAVLLPPPPPPPPPPEEYVTVALDADELVPREFDTAPAGTVRLTGPSPDGITDTVYVPSPLFVVVPIVPPVTTSWVGSNAPPFVVVTV